VLWYPYSLTHKHTHTHTRIHVHKDIHIHIPLPQIPHQVWLSAACVRPCEIPQTLMKSIDVECGDIKSSNGGREEQGVKRIASQNRKKGPNIKQTNQKFTQTSITAQSWIKINKIITTEYNEGWPPTQPRGHKYVLSDFVLVTNTVNNLKWFMCRRATYMYTIKCSIWKLEGGPC